MIFFLFFFFLISCPQTLLHILKRTEHTAEKTKKESVRGGNSNAENGGISQRLADDRSIKQLCKCTRKREKREMDSVEEKKRGNP